MVPSRLRGHGGIAGPDGEVVQSGLSEEVQEGYRHQRLGGKDYQVRTVLVGGGGGWEIGICCCVDEG